MFFLSKELNISSRYAIYLLKQGWISLGLSFSSSASQRSHSLFSKAFALFSSLEDDPIIIKYLMSLIGKKILVVGGNGYTGNYFAARLAQQLAAVSSLSRKGLKYDYPENSKIEWMIGDILSPTKFSDQINQADVVLHTIGTLIDSSVLKGTAHGGLGTYEQVNRDTFASLLQTLKTPKKIIYLSSNAHPPFLERYLTTKHEAEELLFATSHEGYTLRPGFIYSWEHRKWSVPLRYQIELWNKIYPYVASIAPPQTNLQKALKQFKQGECTALEALGDAVIELCLNGSKSKILENAEIQELSRKFRNQHAA